MEATCAGTKQEVTAGVEPGEPVAHGAGWKWRGGWRGHPSESPFLSFRPRVPGSHKSVQRPGDGKGLPWGTQVLEEQQGAVAGGRGGRVFGSPLLHPRMSWRPRSAAPLCTAKGLFIHCFMVVCRGNEGSLGAKGSSSEVWSLPLPAAAGLGRPESGGAW